MYHNDPLVALEELTEDAALPNPVHLRDMILRRNLTPKQALELNRQFVHYQKVYGELLGEGRTLLESLAKAPAK